MQTNAMIPTTDWKGCYKKGWNGNLVPEAFSHPAKVSFGLSEHIYQHIIDEGWLTAGDIVLDPFGGIGGFAFHAMVNGLSWCGVELEERFVSLGNQNIDLWNTRYGGKLPRWGEARLIQGDSRELLRYVAEAGCVISSPPFLATDGGCKPIHGPTVDDGLMARHAATGKPNERYGSSPGQLGAMKAGDVDAVVSSPPFMDNLPNGAPQRGYPDLISGRKGDDYGSSPGQLGAMKAGDVDAVVSSPPWENELHQTMGGMLTPHQRADNGRNENAASVQARLYGITPGQLGAMKAGDVDAVVSSPPFMGQGATEKSQDFYYARGKTGKVVGTVGQEYDAKVPFEKRGFLMGKEDYAEWLKTCNLGSITTSETSFWSAASVIVAQVYAALRPGGHAVWVVKSFVKNKKRVDFPGQWQRLCEAAGFVTVHQHRAWLVEDRGAQYDLTGERIDKTVERKSFFRRLAEKKGSPRIDYEVVLCMVKPGSEGEGEGAAACVSSPPWTSTLESNDEEFIRKAAMDGLNGKANGHGSSQEYLDRVQSWKGYGTMQGNLGNMKPGRLEDVL